MLRPRDGGLSADALDRAKLAVVARWRQEMETNAGIAALIAQATSAGLPAESVRDFPRRVLAVGDADVRAAAQRYLDKDHLRIVLAGDPAFVHGETDLDFGKPVRFDGFGRPMR